MNRESILESMYESYTQIGSCISEAMKTLKTGGPRINPARSKREVQAGMGTKESPSRTEIHSENPRRREFDWIERRMDLEARRSGRGQTATGQPAPAKKPGMIGRLMSRLKGK